MKCFFGFYFIAHKKTEQATSNMSSIRHLYPDATEPTRPKFNVGDLVYTDARVVMPGYTVKVDDIETINHLMNAHGYTKDQVIVQPSVFGTVVEYQEPGTPVVDCGTIPSQHNNHSWRGVEDEHEEAELDLPDSGSIWFLPDNERRYFVKWFNKEPYQYNEDKPNKFTPMKTKGGDEVFNIGLHPEKYMYKAPDFIGKLRKKVMERKEVESVLNNRLNIDDVSVKGIASVVCKY